MNYKIIIGFITTMLFLLSITQVIPANNKINLSDDYLNNLNFLINYENNQEINIKNKLIWYPGLFITLLLAPFIILYLIIAIILDIGNP